MGQRTCILSFMVLLAGCAGGNASDTSETTGTDPTTVATTATSLVTTTTVAATTTTLDGWESIPTWRGGPAGEYRSRIFEVPFRFTTPSAWNTGGGEAVNFLGIGKGQGLSGVFFIARDGPVEETLEFYRGIDTIEITDERETEVGGASGTPIEGTASSNTITSQLAGGQSLGWAAGTRFTTHIVDVNGRTVEVSVDQEGTLPPNFEEETEAILDSIVWQDLEG